MEGEDCFSRAGSNHGYEGGRSYCFHTLRNLDPPPPERPRAEEVGFDEREIPHRRFASYSQVKPHIIMRPRSLDVNEGGQQVSEDLPASGGTRRFAEGHHLTFTSVTSPQMHQQCLSGNAKHQELVCNICARKFASARHLKEHMHMVHENREARPKIGLRKFKVDTSDYTVRKRIMSGEDVKRKIMCIPQIFKPLISEEEVDAEKSGKPRDNLLPGMTNVINHSDGEHYIAVGHTSRASLELMRQPSSTREMTSVGTNILTASPRRLHGTSKSIRHDCEDDKMRDMVYRREGETSTMQRMHERTGEQVVTMFLDMDSSQSQSSCATVDDDDTRRWGLNDENQELTQLDPNCERQNMRQTTRVYGRKLGAGPSVFPSTSGIGKRAVEGSFIGSSCSIAKGRRYIEKVAVGSTYGNGYDSDESEDGTLLSRYDSQAQYTPTLSNFSRPLIKSEYYSHTLQTPNMHSSTPSSMPFVRKRSKCESAHMCEGLGEDLNLNLSNNSANVVEENERFYSSPVRLKRQQLAERAMQLRRAEELVKQQEEEAQERTWQALEEREAALREMEESLKQREAVAQKKIEQAVQMMEESKKICDSKKFTDDESFLHLRTSTSQDEFSVITPTCSTSSAFQSAAQDQEMVLSSKYSRYSQVPEERLSSVEKRLKGDFKAPEKMHCSSSPVLPHAVELDCKDKNQGKTLGSSVVTNMNKVGNEGSERKVKGCKKVQERAGASRKHVYPWEMGEKISAIEPSKILRTYSRVKRRTLTENFSSSYLLSEVTVPPRAQSVASVSVNSSGNLTIYSGHSCHSSSEPMSETVYNEGATITITPVSHVTPKRPQRPHSVIPHMEAAAHRDIPVPLRAGKKSLPSHFYLSDEQMPAEAVPGQVQVGGGHSHHGKTKVEQGGLKFYSHSRRDVKKAKPSVEHGFTSDRSLSGHIANSKGKMSPPQVTISVSEVPPQQSVKSFEKSSDSTRDAVVASRGFARNTIDNGRRRSVQLFKVEPQLKAEVIDCLQGSQGEMEEPSTINMVKICGIAESVQGTPEKITNERNQFTRVSKLEGVVQNPTLVGDSISNQQVTIDGGSTVPFPVSCIEEVGSVCENYTSGNKSTKKNSLKEAKLCSSAMGSDIGTGTVKNSSYKKVSAPVEVPRASHGAKTRTSLVDSAYVSQTCNAENQMLQKMPSSIKHQCAEEPRAIEKLNIIDIPAGVESSQKESFSFGSSTSASDSGVSEILGEYNPATGTFITSDPALLQSLLSNKDAFPTISSVFLENLEKGHLSTKGLGIQHPQSDAQKVNVEIQTDDLPMIEACAHHFQAQSNASHPSSEDKYKKELVEGSVRDGISLILSNDSTSIIKEGFSSEGEGDVEIVSEGLRDVEASNAGNVSSDEDMPLDTEMAVEEQDADISDSEMGHYNQSSVVVQAFENDAKYQFHAGRKETVAKMKNFNVPGESHFSVEKDLIPGVKVERNTFEITESSSREGLCENAATTGCADQRILVEHDVPMIVPERVHESHDGTHLSIVSQEYSDSMNNMMNPMSDPLDVTVKKEFTKVVDSTVNNSFPESLSITVNSGPARSLDAKVKKEPLKLLEIPVCSQQTNGSVIDKFSKSKSDTVGNETALPISVKINKGFMNSFEATLNGEPVMLINASLNKEDVLQSLNSENVQCVGDVTARGSAQPVSASVDTTLMSVSATENSKVIQPISYIVTGETMQSLDSVTNSGVKQVVGSDSVGTVNLIGNNGTMSEPKRRRVSRGGRRLKLKGWWDGVMSDSASSIHHVEARTVEQRETIHCAKSNQSCGVGLEGMEISASDPSKCILSIGNEPTVKKRGRPPVQKLVTKKRRGGWQRKKSPEPDPDDSEYVQITCGKCELVLESRAQFRTHRQEEHNGLARPKGESQEFDEKETWEVWKETFKVTKRLKCPTCRHYFKSLCGFRNHCTLCGRKSEELNTNCHICAKKVRVHTLDKHILKYHQKLGKKDKTNGLENCRGGKRPRRRAAASCNERLKFWRGNKTGESDIDISEMEEEFSKEFNLAKFYSQPKPVTVPNELVQQWEKTLSEQGIGSCSNENCSYQYDTICKARMHYITCEYFQVSSPFVCKMCEFSCTSEEEIIAHITSEHPSCLGSSSEESEGDDVEDRIRKPICRVNSGQIRPYPPAFKMTQEFINQNYSSHLFPTYWTCTEDWIHMGDNELSQYLPELEVSPKVKYISVSKVPEKNKQGEWAQLNRFEGKVIGQSPTMFCGGPIRACAWCPMPEHTSLDTSRQYIALATLPKPESEYKLNQSYVHKGVIQIWEVEALHPNHMQNALTTPKMALGIAHEYGAVWSLDWCPSGIYETPTLGHTKNPLQRIGLLAASCSDGTIRIYIIPHPSQLSVENNTFNVFRKRPDLTLSPVMKLSSDVQCMKVNWFRGKGHSLVAGSFSNGEVCVWDVKNLSPLLNYTKEDGTQILHPFRSFMAHNGVCTSLSFCPTTGGRHLVTGGYDRTYKFWDLENTDMPLSITRKGLVLDTHWLTHWAGSFIAFDDVYGLGNTHSCFKETGFFGIQSCNVMSSNATVWAVTGCDWLNTVAQCDAAGEVVITIQHQLYKSYENDKFPSKRKIPLCALRLEDLSNSSLISFKANSDNQHSVPEKSKSIKLPKKEVKPIKNSPENDKEQTGDNSTLEEPEGQDSYVELPRTYQEIVQQYGIVFVDQHTDDFTSIPEMEALERRRSDTMEPGPVVIYPLTSTTSLAWNNNVGAHFWLVVGTQAGLAKMVCVNGLQHPDHMAELEHLYKRHRSNHNQHAS